MSETSTIHRGFVITGDGMILIQIPDDNRWGFYLADDDQTWDGGFGVASSWEPISADDPRISDDDHDRLDWLLAD